MSKLREAFRRSRRSVGRGMGFAASNASHERSILVGIHTGADASAAAAGLAAGADFGVVHTDHGAAAAAAIAAVEAGEAFFGAHVEALGEGEGEKLRETGCAFIVVAPDRGLAAEADQEDLGVVIPVDIAAEEDDLKRLSRLDIDAVVVPEEIGEITLSRQASLMRVAALTGRRLFVKAAAAIGASELKVLRDSGVGAVLIPDSASAKEVESLLELIATLEPKKDDDDDGRHITLGHASSAEH